jgi:hypothetical protein
MRESDSKRTSVAATSNAKTRCAKGALNALMALNETGRCRMSENLRRSDAKIKCAQFQETKTQTEKKKSEEKDLTQ